LRQLADVQDGRSGSVSASGDGGSEYAMKTYKVNEDAD
jgi:hypothetical protein